MKNSLYIESCKESSRNWIEYWSQDDFWVRSKLWRINAELFFRRVAPILQFRKTDSVLNLGCGPGYLEMHLAPIVESIYALDTSEQFVSLCQKNCEVYPNVTVKRLKEENYTDLSVCGRRFQTFLCVSLVQYYRDMSEVEALIRSAQGTALPGAQMLIADLPQKRGLVGFAWDGVYSFLLSLREGYPLVFLSTAWSWLRKSWLECPLRETTQPLYFSIPEIKDLIRRMKLNATIITTNLSVYANRPSLLIRF